MNLAYRLGNPDLLRKVNGWLAVFWLLHVPPIIVGYLVLRNDTFIAVSLLYTVLASAWANFAGHISAWQAARIEVHQAEDADVQEVLDEVRELKPDA